MVLLRTCLKTKYTQKISENKIILERNDFIFTDFLDILIVFRQALNLVSSFFYCFTIS